MVSGSSQSQSYVLNKIEFFIYSNNFINIYHITTFGSDQTFTDRILDRYMTDKEVNSLI